jgi:hypothetical protein
MSVSRKALCALAAVWFCGAALPVAHAAPPGSLGLGIAAAVSADAGEMARWAIRSGDHGGRPFAVVDKQAARAYVFDAQGVLAGASPVLLGAAVGDRAKPGLGKLAPAQIPRADRTTPAGRFASVPGRNLDGEDVVWFDYDAGLAIHRLRDNAARSARLQRLASRQADAHRVSAGCIVVPVAFYEGVIRPLLGHGRGTLYVLPEERSTAELIAILRDD